MKTKRKEKEWESYYISWDGDVTVTCNSGNYGDGLVTVRFASVTSQKLQKALKFLLEHGSVAIPLKPDFVETDDEIHEARGEAERVEEVLT